MHLRNSGCIGMREAHFHIKMRDANKLHKEELHKEELSGEVSHR